jgi:hypothetical protein
LVGCRPTTQPDFDKLRKQGIRTILLETFSSHIAPERKLADKNEIVFRNVPVFASPLPPKEETIKDALLVLSDCSLRPIYMHCLWGRDRAAVIVGLYRMYYDDWPPDQAWHEVIRSGFKADWSMYGFKTYFWKHTEKPVWATRSKAGSTRRGAAKQDSILHAGEPDAARHAP